MIDIGAIAGLAGSLKSAGEIAKAMMDLRDATTFQTEAFKLSREIASAQQLALASQTAQAAQLDEIRRLKERIVELETWATEKQRYELTDHGCGTFTRTLKPTMASGEPIHRICAQCYDDGQKGFLLCQVYTSPLVSRETMTIRDWARVDTAGEPLDLLSCLARCAAR